MGVKLLALMAAGAMLVPSVAISAELDFTWGDADKFTDIESGDENRTRFRQRIAEGFEEIFQQNVEQLPSDQTLKVTVTNVDLAGHVDMSGTERLRIVQRGHPPMVSFSYELLDADGNSLASGEERLRGRSAGSSASRTQRGSQSLLTHEREMLNDWFRDTFDDAFDMDN